jgi:hypothetical protein
VPGWLVAPPACARIRRKIHARAVLARRPEASMEEVEAAAEAANAREFITRLPEGYNSKVEMPGGGRAGGRVVGKGSGGVDPQWI